MKQPTRPVSKTSATRKDIANGSTAKSRRNKAPHRSQHQSEDGEVYRLLVVIHMYIGTPNPEQEARRELLRMST